MKIRVIKIKGCKHAKEVVLQIVQDPVSDEIKVEISCWHTTKEGEQQFQREIIICNNHLFAERFIIDYSEASANLFANYWK